MRSMRNRLNHIALFTACFVCFAAAAGFLSAQPSPESGKGVESGVPPGVMERIYEQVKTPYKYGIVLMGDEGTKVDSPSVFRHEGRWYMVYIVFNDIGYETELAESDDLLHWEKLGTILGKKDGGWDAKQVAGYIALQDPVWGGSYELERYRGRYWMSYLGGALEGYETDPLAVGIAWTETPSQPLEWHCIPENPVLGPGQPDVRWWEAVTLYKSNIIRDPAESLGYPFVMFYNGKSERGEKIGMAVSHDMVRWERFGDDPVIDNGSGISGDPRVVLIGDVWVMFYFGAFWRPKAFDTFACSRDLVHWINWTGPDLVAPSEPWDETYAHKPWVVYHDGVVYHFYCAVGNRGRVIALAASRDFGSSPLNRP